MTFILLHNDKNENTKFLIAYERAARSIRISIRKTINNLVRPVWEGQMDDIRHTAYGNLPPFVRSAFRSQSSPCQRLSSSPSSSSTPSSSGLAFSRMLGETVAKLQKEVASLKKDNQQLQKNSMQWKSTSDKLINQWQTEKSELTANFLTLFNQHKARHIETFKELEQLKKKHYHESAESNINGNSHLQNREAVVDDEDEHDYVTYDDSLVARLASGPSKKKMRVNDDRKPIHKKEPSLSKKSFPDDVQSSQCSTGFLNPHTGALEISNYKEMFSSDEEEAAV